MKSSSSESTYDFHSITRSVFTDELDHIPSDWEISFPLDRSSRFRVFEIYPAKCLGVIVYRFSEKEARFVFRGCLESSDDLAMCIQAGEELAREIHCSMLVTQEKILPTWLDAAELFKKNSFVALDESWIFECPFKSFAERLNRIMNILQRNGSVPKEARVTGLKEGRVLARSILEEALLMDGFDFDNRLKSSSKKSISEDLSQLVWVGEVLAGIILVAPIGNDGIYEIPVRYVIPSYRQTWVNALLIYSSVKLGEAACATTIRFNANSKTHHETIRLAQQAGCIHVASSHRYGKPILL